MFLSATLSNIFRKKNPGLLEKNWTPLAIAFHQAVVQAMLLKAEGGPGSSAP